MKTHCRHGHVLDTANTVLYGGYKGCRRCRLDATNKWRSRHRRIRPSWLDRLLKRSVCDIVTRCLLVTGPLDDKGYARIKIGKSNALAHLHAYRQTVGPVPMGRELDHACRRKNCWNVEHLEPVTHSENLRRHYAATITHCPKGHLYDEENTGWRRRADGRNKSRFCRACQRSRPRH